MTWWMFSAENMPDRRWQKENAEILKYNGFTPFGAIEAGKWYPLQRVYQRRGRADYQDQQGYPITTLDEEMAQFINANYLDRGILCVADDLYDTQRAEVEAFAWDKHRKYMDKMLEIFEVQRDAKVNTGTGRSNPTLREEAAYEETGRPRPYSALAVESQRNPGGQVAREFFNELRDFVQNMKQERESTSEKVEVAVTVPQEEAIVAAKGEEHVKHSGAQDSSHKRR